MGDGIRVPFRHGCWKNEEKQRKGAEGELRSLLPPVPNPDSLLISATAFVFFLIFFSTSNISASERALKAVHCRRCCRNRETLGGVGGRGEGGERGAEVRTDPSGRIVKRAGALGLGVDVNVDDGVEVVVVVVEEEEEVRAGWRRKEGSELRLF